MKSTALPILLSEYQIRAFKYYWKGRLHSGMTFDGRLYALLSSFEAEERALAYEKGCQLASTAKDVVVTVSRDAKPLYQLWIALSPQNCELLLADKQATSKNNPHPPRLGELAPADMRTPKPEAAFVGLARGMRFSQYVKL
ncbi:MAG: hypothetical protein AAGH78_05060 [Cyanobacteria bacterium P01_H01_bin.58]